MPKIDTKIVIGAENRTKNVFRNLRDGLTSVSKQLVVIQAAAAAAFTLPALARSIGNLKEVADTYQQMNARLKLVTRSSEEFEAAQTSLFQIAQETRNGLEATVSLYTRLGRSTRELGVSQEQLLQVTETISKALIVSGASAQESSAALVQLGQGLASGALRGDELRSVLEQTPRLAQAIAEGMGVSVGQLRELGAQGALTAEAVVNALIKQAEIIDKEFGQIPKTIGQAMTQLGNAFVQFIGQADEAGGVSRRIAEAIGSLARNIDILTDAIWTLGKIIGVAIIGKLTLLIGAAGKGGAALAFQFLAREVAAAKLALLAGATPLELFTIRMKASAAATWASVKAIGAFKLAISGVFAGFIGFEIGSFLRRQFPVVERFGIVLASLVQKAIIRIGFFFSRLAEDMKLAFASPIQFIRTAFAGLVEFIGKRVGQSLGILASAAEFAGADEIAKRLRDGAESIRDGFNGVGKAIAKSSEAAKKHAAAITALRKTETTELAQVESAWIDLFAAASGETKKKAAPRKRPGTITGDGSTPQLDLRIRLLSAAGDPTGIAFQKVNDQFKETIEKMGENAERADVFIKAFSAEKAKISIELLDKIGRKVKTLANERVTATKKALNKSLQAEKKHSDDLKDILRNRANDQRSIDDEIRAKKREGLSPAAAQKDIEAQFATRLRESQQATSGEQNRVKGRPVFGTKKAPVDLARGRELAESARGFASQIDNEKRSVAALQTVRKTILEISKKEEAANRKAAEAQKEKTAALRKRLETEKELALSLKDALTSIGKIKPNVQISSNLESEIAKVKELKRQLASLNGGKASGKAAAKFAQGGLLPGFGGGDRIPAVLESGEFVIRKEAVRRYGAGLFNMLNGLTLARPPGVPRFAEGGAVAAGATAGPAETINLNLNVGGNAFSLFGPRDQVRGLVDALSEASRGG